MVVMLALADGTGAAWAAVGLAICAVQTAAKLLAVLGRREVHLPLQPTASTKGGEIALLVLSSSLMLFCLVWLLLSL